MTDEKKAPEGLGEFDWDKALSEWETTSFQPEVAKDVVTDKPGALSNSPVSRPLYRPPPAPAAGKPPPAPAGAKTRPQKPPPPPVTASPTAPPQEEDDDEGATIVAAIPADLLRNQDLRMKSASRGGLGQLFAREEKRNLGDEAPADVVTSAKVVPDSSAQLPIESLRRPSQADPSERVPEGGFFDPFAEHRPEQKTIPADEEFVRTAVAAAKAGAHSHPPTGAAGGPPLLAPQARVYDPDQDTFIGHSPEIAQAVASLRSPGQTPSATEAPATARSAEVAGQTRQTREWPDEKPASDWVDEAARAELEARANWLEDEARALPDKIARGRGLLSCSEILATVGHQDRAQALAAEARDLAPSLALAHRQARALMPWPPDRDDYLGALDAEVKMTPAGPARVHSMLLAADALRDAGDDDEAAKRLDQAARLSTGDVRAAVARAVRALGRRDTGSPALRLADAPELAPIALAIGACLRLRGVERDVSSPAPPGRGQDPKTAAPAPPSPNELLMRARQSLDRGDVATAAPLVARLGLIPEIAPGATWLAAALGATTRAHRGDAMRWLGELADRGDASARRALTARAVELEDHDLVAREVAAPGPLTPPERATLAALAGRPLPATDPNVDATATTPGMQPLACAVSALAMPPPDDDHDAQVLARVQRTAGSPESRAATQLGRLLAEGRRAQDIESALDGLGSAMSSGARAIALEMAARTGRALDVSAAVEAWGAARGSSEERALGALAAALVAERGGHTARALEAFRAARRADPTCEAALRAIASLEQVDLVAEVNILADDLGGGIRGAITRLEAVARGEALLPEPTQADLLERAHRAAPSLPIAAFLAERIARRGGDIEEVLRWIRERRTHATDPIEAALDAVREALLVADREPALASERLREAHVARPADIALRELYERMATDPPEDRAAWREQRAAQASGDARTLLYLEAAQEYERTGDEESAFRCAEAAATTETALGRVVRERIELRTSRVARLADELLTMAKTADGARPRCEAYERLAALDASARNDPASALLWHRSILEELPDHKPSLRHLEQHLIGEGRDDELEPIASSIASALRGTGPGECTAHAELAARLRMRGATGSWEATRDLVELAAAEDEPSTWSLRMLQAHARARGDDSTLLSATRHLIDRASRPAELATLLVRASESAFRLGNLEEARVLLQRATTEDPGDVVAWGLLADVRQRAGDARGAGEACESLARSSLVRDHQLLAWYDAARIWLDEAKDEERAVVALEAAAAIDVSHRDVFDRLSHIYAARKMQPELADLLERRIDLITDPEERLAMEVRRGRVLLEAGDVEGARSAFQSALTARPDDPAALSAFADLCVAQRDWEAAEQALIRLARLLPTPEDQRDVYGRLGELYSHHLLNLSRAEVALKEVLKRAPDDADTAQKLVDVYKRQNDPARALELQQELVTKSRSPEEKRLRVLELAALHEHSSRDNRRAEQTLEAGRREFPQDVGLLRALAEFYVRHRQTPAVNILLDRAGADARRGLAAGRLAPSSFQVLAAVFDLRGKKDAARATQAMLDALEGRASELRGGGDRAFDSSLDDLLAPDVLSPAMRALLARTGDALDAAAPPDLRALKATPMAADSPLALLAMRVAGAIGLEGLQVLSSPKLGKVCLPAGSTPPLIVAGDALATDERVAPFLVLRALKLVLARASALARATPGDFALLVSAWLKCFHPTWQPQGINAAALATAVGRVHAALPHRLDPDVGMMALEIASNMGTRQATVGPAGVAWANRVALLALGDPNVALDSIAAAGGASSGAPRDPKGRAAWVARTPEARDLVAFGVTDAFAEARTRLALDR